MMTQATTVAIAAVSVVEADAESLTRWRTAPGTLRGHSFPATALRSSDEQTVLAVVAVLQAIEQLPTALPLNDWAVVAAPCYLGEQAAADYIANYSRSGIRVASPLFVPHFSTHSVSGTLSVLTGMQGANFGVGGGPEHVLEGLLAGHALWLDQKSPGVWLVLTGWDGRPHASPCRAVALALSDPVQGDTGWRLELAWGEPVGADAQSTLTSLCRVLTSQSETWVGAVPGGAIRLFREVAA